MSLDAHHLLKNFGSFTRTICFEFQDVSERKIRFTSNLSAKDLIERIEDTVTEMGFRVQNKNGNVSTIISLLLIFV